MTMTNPTSIVSHIGNGATTIFPYSFLIPANAGVITTTEIDTGIESSTLIEGIHYTITGEDDPAGGTVTYPVSGTALPNTHTINIRRITDVEQTYDMTTQSAYDPATLEDALDKLALKMVEIDDRLDLAVLTTPGSGIVGSELITTLNELVAEAQATSDAVLAQLVPFNNLVLNGNFDIWQRGAGPFAADAGYTADQIAHATDTAGITAAITRQSHTLGQTDVPGNPKYFLRYDCSVAGSGATYNSFILPIRGVHNYAGKTITVTLWAKGTAGKTIRPDIYQKFGTGGAPSANVFTGGTAMVIAATWQKFSQTIDVPSIAGKTLGTNGDDYVSFEIKMPFNDVVTIDLSRISIVEGTVTGITDPAKYLHPDELLAEMMAYYQTFSVQTENGSRWIALPRPTWKTPNVGASAGTPANASIAGFELSHVAAASSTITVTASVA